MSPRYIYEVNLPPLLDELHQAEAVQQKISLLQAQKDELIENLNQIEMDIHLQI